MSVATLLVPFVAVELTMLTVCVLADRAFDALWLGYLLCPWIAVGAAACGALSGSEWASFLGALHLLVGVPLLDALLGAPRCTPGTGVCKAVRASALGLAVFEWALLLWVCVHADLSSFWRSGGLVLSVGVVNGAVGVSAAHELFHSRRAPLAHAVSFLLLGACGYCTFYFMHRHHHVNVATPLDGTTARRGEPFLWFVRRSFFGGLVQAWHHEQRVRRGAINRVAVALLAPFAVTIGVLALALWCTREFDDARAFGAALSVATQFFVVQSAVGVLTVELGNYLQHYGMQRRRSQLDSERFERVQPHHSWDCNLLAFNFTVNGVSQHSHHHVEPGLSLGTLRPQLAPSLPHDYFSLYFIAAWLPFVLTSILDARLDAFNQQLGESGDSKLADFVDHVSEEATLDVLEGIL